jgi:hypothetical protein
MKTLLTVTAAIEVGAGLALAGCPAAAVALLLGSSLDTPATLTLGRIAGAALLSLGVACWLARHDGQGRATRGVAAAMALYNIAVVALLVSAGLWSGLRGIALWPAVVLHATLTVWCFICLRSVEPGGGT